MIEPADQPARLRALTAIDSTLLVEAAAGTGKTALIAGRIALALMSGMKPRELAAITFTQAAADELSIRINKYATELLDGRVPDCLQPALPNGLSSAQRETLRVSSKALDELTVTTIHGFCQKLIVRHAVEADIDPGARMMDGPQAESAFSSVFQRWIRGRLTQTKGPSDPIEALSRDDPRSVVRTLKDLAAFRLKHRTARSVSADLSTRLDIELVTAVTAFRDWMNEAPAETETRRLVAELELLAQFYCDCLASVPHFSRLWALAHPPRLRCMWDESSELKRPKLKSAWQELLGKDRGADLNDQAESHFGRVNAAYRALHGRIATALCDVLSREIAEVLDEYVKFKRDAAVLDFDDLLHYAQALVRGHQEVRCALGKRYRQILVDEFQDTDPLQAEILFRIAASEASEDWERCALRAGALFMVGDPKQAIYRFRGADIDSYTRARNAIGRRWPENIIQITANFRSVPDILTYINGHFQQALDEPGQPGYVSLTPVRSAPNHQLPCVAKRTLSVHPDCNAKELREAEAADVANLCARLIGNLRVPDEAGKLMPLGPEGIALLTPNHVNLWRYERALEARGLPFASRAAKSLFRRQEVQDVLALARALADPDDTLAFGALLRGPLMGLTEQELLDIAEQLPGVAVGEMPRFTMRTELAEIPHVRAREILGVLQELRRLERRTTPALLLAEAVERLSLRPLLAAREGNRRSKATANVDRFLDLAKAYDTSGLRQFVRDMSSEWASQRDERVEGRVDSDGAIELVTMHSSKGLEWPVVILINTVGKVTKRGEFVHRASDNTIHWILRDVEPPELASALEEDGRISESERQRVLYVACSRARELLVIPHVPPRNYKSWSGVLTGACDGLPELPVAGLPISRASRSAEAQNEQTVEGFAQERDRIASAIRKITWIRPSDDDHDRMPALPDLVAEDSPATPENPVPAGAGRTRGLVLHKLLEEVLTGEVARERGALTRRADELMGQLVGGRSDAKNVPDAAELAGTVLRTLALPEVAAMKLIPETTIYGMQGSDGELIGLAGRADALVLGSSRVSVVVDWKSDVAPTSDDMQAHAGQLLKYMKACGAPRGAIVYVTPGTVHWVQPDE